MRRLQLLCALFAISLFTAACSGAASKSETPNSSGNGEASQAASSAGGDGGGGGGGGGGANGSVSYRISGDYTKSGELPFVPVGLSLFADGGWVAWFAEESGDSVIQLNTNADTAIVNFGNSEISIIGTEETGCTFDFTKNDSGGLAGSFECHATVGVSNTDGSQVHVDMSGEWDAQP